MATDIAHHHPRHQQRGTRRRRTHPGPLLRAESAGSHAGARSRRSRGRSSTTASAIGARALTAAQTTSDVAIVEKAFGEMTSSFTRGLDGFGQELEKKTQRAARQRGRNLAAQPRRVRRPLEELLGDTFDPDSKKSAIAMLEQVMRKAALEQVKATRALIDPDNETARSAATAARSSKRSRRRRRSSETVVEELKTQLAVDDGKAEIFELTTKKGFIFEDELENRLIAACQPLGDVAERVGGTSGSPRQEGRLPGRSEP